ncbi:MAG: hypothetical protein L6V84_07235 [Oscillospiraceae bacterium]|nr:MAG: hypothetical protein L6V84_07235 [Oscillospiraceae bacterium]
MLTVAVFAGGAVFLSACRTPGQAPDSPSATATETETVTTEMSGVTEPGNSETETEPESGAGEETAHLHAYGDWAILRAPTCTGAGERTHTCTVCGHVETESVPATGHTSVEDAAVPASCTEDGKTAGAHCAVCGDVLTAQETVPALGHLSEKTEAVLPTCTQNGHGTGVRCGRCGLVLAEPPEIPATGHQPETVPGKTAHLYRGGADGRGYLLGLRHRADRTDRTARCRTSPGRRSILHAGGTLHGMRCASGGQTPAHADCHPDAGANLHAGRAHGRHRLRGLRGDPDTAHCHACHGARLRS